MLGNSLKSLNRPSGPQYMGFDRLIDGGNAIRGDKDGLAREPAQMVNTPAIWPTDPPDRNPYARSVRKYSGDSVGR